MNRVAGAPFVIDVRGLGRRPGSMTRVHRTVMSNQSIGLDMLAIPASTPIDCDLRLESVSEGVLVTGTISAATAGQCARCLEAISGTANVFFTELFAYPDSETEQTTDEDEVHRVVGDVIDLEQSVIDAVGLDLPIAPLCREDCPGLCAECGTRLETADPGHSHDIIDARWSALTEMLQDPETLHEPGEPAPVSESSSTSEEPGERRRQ